MLVFIILGCVENKSAPSILIQSNPKNVACFNSTKFLQPMTSNFSLLTSLQGVVAI